MAWRELTAICSVVCQPQAARLPAALPLPAPHAAVDSRRGSGSLTDSVIPEPPPELAAIIADYLWQPLHSVNREPLGLSLQRIAAAHPAVGGVEARLMCVGGVYADTVQTDDWTPELRALLMRGFRIAAILHREDGKRGGGCRGLQLTYRSRLRAAADRQQSFTAALHGRALASRDDVEHCFELAAEERIRQVTLRYRQSGVGIDALTLETSRGRRCEMGSRPSVLQRDADPGAEWHVKGYRHYTLIPPADVAQCEVLAVHVGAGRHMHNVGVYYLLSDSAS